jgi:hypothetical protein
MSENKDEVEDTIEQSDDEGETAFIGGSAVSYILAETSGRIVLSETLTGLARREYNLSSSNLTEVKYYGFEPNTEKLENEGKNEQMS